VYGVLGGKLVNIVDSDGSATRLALSSGARTAAWVMNFTSYGQLGCTDRRGHGLYPYINGLSTSGNTYATLGGYEN